MRAEILGPLYTSPECSRKHGMASMYVSGRSTRSALYSCRVYFAHTRERMICGTDSKHGFVSPLQPSLCARPGARFQFHSQTNLAPLS